MKTKESSGPSLIGRAASAAGDAFRIRGWAELPADPNGAPAVGQVAVASAFNYQLCGRVEDGWEPKAVEGVGIPPRTDGTQPRAV